MNTISSVVFGIENDCINEPDHIFYEKGDKFFVKTLRNRVKTLIMFFMPSLFYKLKFRFVPTDIEEFFFSIVNQTIEHREKNIFTRNDFMQMLIQLKSQGYVSADRGEKESEEMKEKWWTSWLSMSWWLKLTSFLLLVGFKSKHAKRYKFDFFSFLKSKDTKRQVQQCHFAITSLQKMLGFKEKFKSKSIGFQKIQESEILLMNSSTKWSSWIVASMKLWGNIQLCLSTSASQIEITNLLTAIYLFQRVPEFSFQF